MKFRLVWAAALLLIVGGCIAGVCLSGCTADNKATAANDLNGAAANLNKASTFLVGSATTQPATVVRIGEAVEPASTPYVAVAGYGLMALATLLGAAGTLINGNKAAAAQQLANTAQTTAVNFSTLYADAKSAIAEVVADVKAWNNPGQSFTAKTEKIVTDVAGIVAAAPAVSTPVIISDATPISAAIKTAAPAAVG